MSKAGFTAAPFSPSFPLLTPFIQTFTVERGGYGAEPGQPDSSMGLPAVRLMFNQAPGFGSQQACAPLTPTICGSLSLQNPHPLL